MKVVVLVDGEHYPSVTRWAIDELRERILKERRFLPASATYPGGIPDIVERDGSATEHVGGSPANVALTLARLGRPATLVTDIADDERGRRIAEHLGASGVTVLHGDAERTSTARATGSMLQRARTSSSSAAGSRA